jgi:hypothetical protein
MSYQLRGDTQLVTATVNTGTATFSLCVTNTFLIQNATAQAAWANVYLGAGSTPAGFHHAILGDPAPAIYIPGNTSQVISGNFDVSGGGQTVIVNHITAASSATLVVSPVTLNQYQSSI